MARKLTDPRDYSIRIIVKSKYKYDFWHDACTYNTLQVVTMCAAITGLGLHYSPDGDIYRQQDADLWIPELQSLGIRWLAVSGRLSRAIPTPFLERILAAGIEPVLLLTQGEIQPMGETEQSILRTYQRAGVKLVSPYPSPNMRTSWPSNQWPRTSPVESFLDVFIPAAEKILTEGLIPVFPALKFGGEYWDLSFLEGCLTGFVQRNQDALARKMVMATEMAAHNRPLDWGHGGSSRWPLARPYITPPGSQDANGFQGYIWRDEIIRRVLGASLPMIGVYAGATLEDHLDPAFPAVDASIHADINLQVAQMAAGGNFSAPMLCVLFWVLQAAGNQNVDRQAWYRSDGTVLPLVDALKRRVAVSHTAQSVASQKNIRHYVLLPDSPVSLTASLWNQVRGYLQAFQASCGFSLEEALHAEKVTVVGDSAPSAVLLRLRDSGCFVEFLSPEHSS
jgi:hypothetical protein